MKKKPSSLRSSVPPNFTEEISPADTTTIAKKTNGKTKKTSSKDVEFSDELDNRELLKILS